MRIISYMKLNWLTGDHLRTSYAHIVLSLILLPLGVFFGLSSANATSESILRGTAIVADGASLAGGAIDLVDSAGHPLSATSNGSGKFRIDVSGLNPPFLMRATSADGSSTFYSVSLQAGVANIDVYTDLILNLLCAAQGTTAAAQFASATPLAIDYQQLQLVSSVVESAIINWLLDDKVKVATFDFVTKQFPANHHKFDKVLAQTTIVAPFSGTSETLQLGSGDMLEIVTFTADPVHGTITANGSATIGGNTSNFQLSTNLPTPDQAVLLDGINATLAQLQSIVDARRKSLAASDVSPLFDPQYLHGGEDATIGEAELVTTLRDLKDVRDMSVSRLNSIAADTDDSSQDDVDVVWQLASGKGQLRTFSEVFRCPVAGGNCSFYGNRQIVETLVNELPYTTSNLNGTSTSQDLNVQSLGPNTPSPAVSAVSIQDSGAYFPNPTPLPLSPVISEELFYPTESSQMIYTEDNYFLLRNVTNDPLPLGATFQFNVTPADGEAPITYLAGLAASGGEPIQLTQPAPGGDHQLASAPLGKKLTIEWRLPQSYPVQGISLTAQISNAGCVTTQQLHPLKLPVATSTSGKFKLPKTMPDGSPIAVVQFDLGMIGQAGPMAHLTYQYGACGPS